MLEKAVPSLAEKYLHLGGCGRICACGDASRTIRGIRREERVLGVVSAHTFDSYTLRPRPRRLGSYVNCLTFR